MEVSSQFHVADAFPLGKQQTLPHTPVTLPETLSRLLSLNVSESHWHLIHGNVSKDTNIKPEVIKILYEIFYMLMIDGFKTGNDLKQGDGLARNLFNTIKRLRASPHLMLQH
jgi:hypothetical protein